MDDYARPESFLRRLFWKNSGILCVATLITLPIILGVALGYVIVLAVVTSYRKITGQKSREEKESEAAKKIRIVLGHELLDSAFTKAEKLPGQKKVVRRVPRYGSLNEAANVSLSSDGNESEEGDTETGDEEEGLTEEMNERNNMERNINKIEELKNEIGGGGGGEVGDVQGYLDNNSVVVDNMSDTVGVNESSADHDTSRAASASSEYYSTASEMDDPGRGNESGCCEKPTEVPQESFTIEDDTAQELHSVKTVVQDIGRFPNKETSVGPEVPEVAKTKLDPRSQAKSHASMSLGKLKYSIQYMKETNQLQVSVLKAINLFEKNHGSCPSSYVRVSLLPQRYCWQRTKVVEETRNPVYNETFVISGFSYERLGGYTLLICVVDAASQWRGYYGDDVIGEVHVPLVHLAKCSRDNEEKVMCEWAELKPRVTEMAGLSKCGKINLALCYRPISGRLIVTIKKTKDLKCESKETFDPYVKLALYCGGTRVGRGATRVKRKVTNPAFNEKFNFDLTADQIAYTTVVVKVVNNLDGTACVGATVVGYESTGNGQEHWLCMLKCLSQHVDAWHTLYD